MDVFRKLWASAQRVWPQALVLGVLLLCLFPARARAQEDAPELRRELAGHNFIPSRFSLDPFVSTYVASETGFGYGTAAGFTYSIAGHPVTLANYEVGGYAQILDYQYGFLPWWAVRVDFQVTGYSGINSSGVAVVGTNAVVKAGLGTTLSWKVGDNLRLGGSLDVTFGPSIFFNILKTVQESIDHGDIVSPVTSAGSYTFQPAFVGAWAIEKWVGFTFSASYQFTNATTQDNLGQTTNAASFFLLNGVFDFDLNPACKVPIGFLAGFQTAFSASQTRFLQFRWQTGIFYTAVKPLNVGLEIDYVRAPVVGSTEVFLSSLLGLIVLQYNFN